MYKKDNGMQVQWLTVTACLCALSQHIAQVHHWLVDGLEFALHYVVHTPGVTLLLELEGWMDQLSDLTLYCWLLVVVKRGNLMFASRLQCVQDLGQLVCL